MLLEEKVAPITEDELAQAALFLVSDRSSAITGRALSVDGGIATT